MRAAIRNYRGFPNVCGVSFGAKFSEGILQEGVEAIQFFVTEKLAEKRLKRRLPKNVFLRRDDGDLDRSKSIPTDVIELRNLRLCCKAGHGVGSETGVEGSIALIFENHADDNQPMMLTCSHVATDLISDDQHFDISGGGDGCFFAARTVAFTSVENATINYDIALAEISQIGDYQPLRVRGNDQPLTGFSSPDQFAQGDEFDCRSALSLDHTIKLQSAAATFENVTADQVGEISVHNLYACTGQVEPGDSGGIVYSGDQAVGMIVAKADDGWVFIHALSDAIAFLSATASIDIEVF